MQLSKWLWNSTDGPMPITSSATSAPTQLAQDDAAMRRHLKIIRPSDEPLVTGSIDARASSAPAQAQPATSPYVGTPEWEKEQAGNERMEQRIRDVMKICRGC